MFGQTPEEYLKQCLDSIQLTTAKAVEAVAVNKQGYFQVDDTKVVVLATQGLYLLHDNRGSSRLSAAMWRAGFSGQCCRIAVTLSFYCLPSV